MSTAYSRATRDADGHRRAGSSTKWWVYTPRRRARLMRVMAGVWPHWWGLKRPPKRERPS